MTHPGDRGVSGTPGAQHLDYRVAHLRDRLAGGPLGELGVRVEAHGDAVLVTGCVPSARCRDDIRRIVREELAGLVVHCDIMVTDASSPDHAEDLT
ncbi:BON domain-containing protein [Streptomyces sp. HC307]|uniref:BON domain-containing protein n=1 Tax=Streptomyces flavusporus TaxID=3385496 RepID=UPI0039173D75